METLFAKFDGQWPVGGPQSINPGDWVEVVVDAVPVGTPVEWDFTGEKPRLRARLQSQQEIEQIKANEVRQKRNQLLAESDWTDTYSASQRMGQSWYDSWQAYRQQLRNVTNQYNFPMQVEWPAAPY